MAIYDFTGANGDPLPSGLVARVGTFEIQSNKLSATGTASGALWVATTDGASQIGTELSDGTVVVTVNAEGSTSGASGPVFRYAEPANFWAVFVNAANSGLVLFRREAGTYVNEASYTIPAFSNTQDYVVKVVFSGDSIEVFLDDVSRITHTSTFNQTNFLHGVRLGNTTYSVDTLTVPEVAGAVGTIASDVVDEYIQRLSGNISLPISGTYTGTPTNIERKVIYTDDLSTVVGFDWATYITSPVGGTFAGASIVLPESVRQYRVDLRFSNAVDITASTGGFRTADKWLIYGQSLARQLSTDGADITPNALSKYANPISGAYTTPTVGNGTIQLLNTLVSETGFAQIATNVAVGGMALLEDNLNVADNFLWRPVTTDTVRYLEVKAAITAIGGEIAGAIFSQGERDGQGGISLNTYQSSLSSHFAQLRADTKADLKIVIGVLGRTTENVLDSDWNTIQQAHIAVANADVHTSYTIKHDLPLIDTLHLTDAGYTQFGQRLANNIITNVLGGVADWQSPTVASIETVSTTSTRVNLSQGQGTDFTPTTGITGIELTEAGDGYGVTGITAARETSTSILVTHNAATVTAGRLYFGASPVITGIVLDNSTLNLPIAPTTISVNAIANTAPVANAGVDQVNIVAGATVTLNGTGSSDADSDALTYLWTPHAGITLSSNTVASPTFTAPTSGTPQTLTFSLVVNDGTENSIANTVDIGVLAEVVPIPVSFVGTVSNKTVAVDGSLSINVSGNFTGTETPFTYALQSGTLPIGVTLNTGTGVISGTPTIISTNGGISVRATDTAANTADTNTFSIDVVESFTRVAEVTMAELVLSATEVNTRGARPHAVGGGGPLVVRVTDHIADGGGVVVEDMAIFHSVAYGQPWVKYSGKHVIASGGTVDLTATVIYPDYDYSTF